MTSHKTFTGNTPMGSIPVKVYH